MASKTSAKTRNTDRRSGKAWGKNHNAPKKVLSAEDQERKTQKESERKRKRPVASSLGGPPFTMPRITWEWFGETLRGMHTRTKRYRAVESFMLWSKVRPNV